MVEVRVNSRASIVSLFVDFKPQAQRCVGRDLFMGGLAVSVNRSASFAQQARLTGSTSAP